MRTKMFVVLAAAVVVGGSGVEGQTVLVGTTGFEGNCMPIGCHSVSRYQQVYERSVFQSQMAVGQEFMSIGMIQFFYGGFDASSLGPRRQAATFNFFLSTTNAAVNALSATNLDDNIGIRREHFATWVSDGGTTTPPGTLDFHGSAYDYYPADGNLLMEIVVDNYTEGPWFNLFDKDETYYLDAGYYSRAADFSRAWAVSTPMRPWNDFLDTMDPLPDGTYADNNGLVTQFGPTGPQTVVPEPMTIGLLATGLVGIAGAARRRRRRGASEDC